MKLSVRQIMEFRQAVDKINLYYEDRVRESEPGSEERRRLGNLTSSHQQLLQSHFQVSPSA